MYLLEKETPSQTSFRQTDWEGMYNQAISEGGDEEVNNVINQFIDTFLSTNNLPQDIGFRDALFNQLKAYGGKALTPNFRFLDWIIQYNKSTDGLTRLTNEGYNNLIDAHGRNIVLDSDLTGQSSLKDKNIIFVEDLFNKDTNNFIFLTQVFYYLNSREGSKSFFDKYNKLNNLQLNEFYQILGYSNASSMRREVTPESIKNIICFKSGNFSNKGELRDTKVINDALEYLDRRIPEERDSATSALSQEQQDIIKLTKDGLKNLGYKEKFVDGVIDTIIKSERLPKNLSLDNLTKLALNTIAAIEGKLKQ